MVALPVLVLAELAAVAGHVAAAARLAGRATAVPALSLQVRDGRKVAVTRDQVKPETGRANEIINFRLFQCLELN